MSNSVGMRNPGFTQVLASWFTNRIFRHLKFDMGKSYDPSVLLVITSEHIGHRVVTSKIVGRDLLTDPGLQIPVRGQTTPFNKYPD